MKFFATAVAAAGALAAAGSVTAAAASADAGDVGPSTHPIGTQGTVQDGGVIQGWTVSDLQPSSDAIPYQPRGTLWEATATDVAIQGNVTPMIANLGARSASGQTYPALFTVATAQGVNPGNLAQGQKTSGKVYFDVTGDAPNSAIYQGAGQDLLVWAPAAPTTPAGGSSAPAATGSQRASGPAASGTKPAQPGAQVAPAATETTPAAAGSQGTPLPVEAGGTPASGPAPSSQQTPGTPTQSETSAAAGSSGTPLPAEAPGASTTEATGTTGIAGSAGTGSEGTASAASGNQGTPLPAAAPGTPAATGANTSTTSN